MFAVGIVVIGRNEGARLSEALAAARVSSYPVVYVDSGSSDDSLAVAHEAGAYVVSLDPSRPFTAARARNEGFDELLARHREVRYVQFVDGDCLLEPGWIEVAVSELDGHPDVAAVCGRRREQYPRASIYNAVMDIEWAGPAGAVRSCGGDAMFRVRAFQTVGGFNPTILAGEEPELCMRLRRNSWKIHRLDAAMTRHDAKMRTLGQWLARERRTGYGSLDVGMRFGDPHFLRIVQRARVWGVVWPLSVVILGLACWVVGGPIAGIVAAVIVVLIWPVQILRMTRRTWRRGDIPLRIALTYAALTMLGKWSQLRGQIRWRRDMEAGRHAGPIEYKKAVGTVPRSMSFPLNAEVAEKVKKKKAG